MKTQHTSGPWFASIHKDSPDQPAIALIRAVDTIAGMRQTGDYTEETFAANAHLIAASPELFEACEAAAQFIGVMAGINPGRTQATGRQVHDQLMSALIRARGGQIVQDAAPKPKRRPRI